MKDAELIFAQIPLIAVAIAILLTLVVLSYKGPLAKIIDQMMEVGVMTVLVSLAARPLMAVGVALSVLGGAWAFIVIGWPFLLFFWNNLFMPALKNFLAKPY